VGAEEVLTGALTCRRLLGQDRGAKRPNPAPNRLRGPLPQEKRSFVRLL